MGFWDRLTGRSISASAGKMPGPTDDFWFGEASPATGAGIRVTPEVAIKAAAVFACVSKIAKIMAILPCAMYQRKGTVWIANPDHFLEEILRYQPNFNHTAVEFWQQMMWHALLRGTAYAEVVSTNAKPVAALVPLHPDTVRPERLPNDKWRYRVTDPQTGLQRTILSADMFRFGGLVTGGIQGMGVCNSGSEAIAVSYAADQYASRVFSNMLNAGIILEHPGKLSEQAQTNLISALMRRLSGASNAHRPMVLQEGMKAQKGFTQTAEEAQLLEARKWQTLEICRILDMPPIMVGINEGALGANVEEQSLNFVRYTLMPWATVIEQAIRRDLIPMDAKGKVNDCARFDFQSLLRGNAQARGDYFSKALGSGGSPAWMAVNEVRIADGLNPISDPLFDKPALGTNPKQTPGTTNPNNEPNDTGDQEADPKDKKEPAEERVAAVAPKTYADKCAALVDKELKILRKYAERYAADFDAWSTAAGAFYRSHVSCVMKTIGVDKGAARIYCRAREMRLREFNDILSAIDALEQRGVAELVN